MLLTFILLILYLLYMYYISRENFEDDNADIVKLQEVIFTFS